MKCTHPRQKLITKTEKESTFLPGATKCKKKKSRCWLYCQTTGGRSVPHFVHTRYTSSVGSVTAAAVSTPASHLGTGRFTPISHSTERTGRSNQISSKQHFQVKQKKVHKRHGIWRRRLARYSSSTSRNRHSSFPCRIPNDARIDQTPGRKLIIKSSGRSSGTVTSGRPRSLRGEGGARREGAAALWPQPWTTSRRRRDSLAGP